MKEYTIAIDVTQVVLEGGGRVETYLFFVDFSISFQRVIR
jgi:hypothetical protein